MDVLSSALALAYDTAQLQSSRMSASSSDNAVSADATQTLSDVEQTFAEIVESATLASSDQLCSTTELASSSTETSVSTSEDDSATATASTSGYSFAASDDGDPAPAAPWEVDLVTPTDLPALASNVKTAVATALAAAGVDPSTCKCSYWEEQVYSPFGNWINRAITIETANGCKMDFDAAAALASPDVTASEVKSYLLSDTLSA